VKFATDPASFRPYLRNPETLARPWALPGTPDLEHRIGGLEKADGSGNVSYDPLNHEHMVRTRAEKVQRVADMIPEQTVEGDDSGELLVVGWGSTYGAIAGAVRHARRPGLRIGHAHVHYLNPLPKNLGEILGRYEKVLVPELNLGQFAFLLQGHFVRPVVSYPKVQGKPFTEAEILDKINELLHGGSSNGNGGRA
jgi:2-oxoglutarate ferredoxin oxidoreductase subunit alpha